MPTAHVNGVELWYELEGAGEPMVLIGGGNLDRENYDPVAPYLRKHFTLVRFDQRGYGKSDGTGVEDATFERRAADAVGLVEALGLPRAHFNGTSNGGDVAMLAAILSPHRAISVIADSPLVKPDRKRRLRLQGIEDHARSAGRYTRGIAAHAATALSPDFLDRNPTVVDDYIFPTLEQQSIDCLVSAARWSQEIDLTSGLPTCNIPMLIIAGDSSDSYPLDALPSGVGARGAYELLPNAELMILEDFGHGVLFSRSQEYAAWVAAFADRVRRGVQTKGVTVVPPAAAA